MRKLFAGMVALALTVVFGFAGVALAGDPGKGKDIFNGKRKCKTCHKLSAKKKVGPGLKGVTQRRSEGWILKFVQDPQGTWVENDAETQKLREWKKGRVKAKKTTMKFKPKLSADEAADVYAFLKQNDG